MRIKVGASHSGGSIKAIASKSAAHRLLICAAFADRDTLISCEEVNEDISATVRCLSALGAKIERRQGSFLVSPIEKLKKGAALDCGESGSTLRFLLPVTCMLGADASFSMSGRLPKRPLSPLREELERCGIELSETGSNPLVCRGIIKEREFSILGNVSSQFISGLLFAIAVSGKGGRLRIVGNTESKPYIDLTVDTLGVFGIKVINTSDGYEIADNCSPCSPVSVSTEGDWSNAAFPLCMGVLGKQPVSVRGLCNTSSQGDRRIIEVLRRMGGEIVVAEDSITAYPSKLCGIEIDGSQIPDLVPVLATVASVSKGRTVIYNAGRLRIKESDRLGAVCNVLNSLGGKVVEAEDGLIIDGVPILCGGEISSHGDHRIVMSGGVAAFRCTGDIVIDGAEAVAKSYPAFFEDMGAVGLRYKEL